MIVACHCKVVLVLLFNLLFRKRKIHKLLLTVLEIEDYYVDGHSVILNLNTSNYWTL